MPQDGAKKFFGLVDGSLALSAAYMAIGLLALERGWHAVVKALLTWGAGFSGSCCALKSAWPWKCRCSARMPSLAVVYLAYGAALAALAALAVLARERDTGRLVIIVACAVGLTIPLMFFGLAGTDVLRRALVSAAVFASAVGLIAGGLLAGLHDLDCRRLRGVRCVDLYPALANHRLVAEPVAVLPGSGVALLASRRVPTDWRTGAEPASTYRRGARPDAVLDNLIARVPLLLRYVAGRAGALRTDPGHRCAARGDPQKRPGSAARDRAGRPARSVSRRLCRSRLSDRYGQFTVECRRPRSSGTSKSL